MCGKASDGKPGSPASTALLATMMLTAVILAAAGAPGPARADDGARPPGLWDSLLEKLDVKASPAQPAPDFVRRSRPDATGLGYMQPAVPHKVSPLPVKTPDQIQAEKNALDAAKTRQLQPQAPPALELAKAKRATKAKPAPAIVD